MTTETVTIFDTTLRDGEQSPGATMTAPQKLEVAHALSRLGVDVIETGFPAASRDDWLAVRAIAERVGTTSSPKRSTPPIICALARASKADIDSANEALRPASRRRIHTFLATSDIHLAHKLRMTRSEVIERVRSMVAYARERCEDVEFSPEDGARTDPTFLYEVLSVAIASGATTLNIPDTVGWTTPDEMGALIAGIRRNVAGIERAVISVHCHDDLGMATANTLAALRNGARQAEVTINGIGERAGNCALEEVVMAIATRSERFGLRTGIDTTQLAGVSRLVSATTGIVVQPNKAIVGANAFAHESGIHQDGMIKNEETYEIMRPSSVGATETRLVLGKHSGRHGVRQRLEELGHVLSDEALDEVFRRFKALAEKRKEITSADLGALVASAVGEPEAHYELDGLQVACGTTGMPTASVRLRGPDGTTRSHAAIGSGPVHAAFLAVDEMLGVAPALLEFSVRSVTEGIDAQGEVTVRIRVEGRVFHGRGADTDIVVASARAYVAAINRLVASGELDRPEPMSPMGQPAEQRLLEGVTEGSAPCP